VDFTIEVERALRVLDGAVLVLCAVAGVHSQSLTVDRQMRRYGVPRIAIRQQVRSLRRQPAARPVNSSARSSSSTRLLLQFPIGLEDRFEGVVDLVYDGGGAVRGRAHGERLSRGPSPPSSRPTSRRERGDARKRSPCSRTS
jgi:elongation factor G